jgi:hypothetical protein
MPKKARKKKNKELERRVVEEEKKLLEEQKNKKLKLQKRLKQPKPKKEKELSDKVDVKKKSKEKEESVHKKIDYQRFLEQQQRKLDYSAMFSYLGNLKKPEYEYSGGMPDIVKMVYKKEETLSWEEIKEFTEEWKMDEISNFNRSFETSDQRTAYRWWKYLNLGVAQFLYEVSLT